MPLPVFEFVSLIKSPALALSCSTSIDMLLLGVTPTPTSPAKVALLPEIAIGASVSVFESDHITTSFAVPLPSTTPPSVSIILPLESTAKFFATVPVLLPEP